VTDERPLALYRDLGEVLPSGWRDATPWGYPDQVELAVVAGVFRAQVPQAGVDSVVDTFMRARPHDLLDDLTTMVNGGVAGTKAALGPRWGDTNVLGVPVLRAAVIYAAAEALVQHGVRSGADLRAAALERPDDIAAAFLGVRGLGQGTWESICVLAHARVRPNALVMKYVESVVGSDTPLGVDETTELLRLAARRFASDERVLSAAVRAYVADTAI